MKTMKEFLGEATQEMDLSDTTVVTKSTWKELIDQLANGMAFIGSAWNKTPKEVIAANKKSFDTHQKFYATRKLVGGKSALKLAVLDDKGIQTGVSGLDKKGKVFKYRDLMFCYDGHATVVYGVVT